MKERKFADEDVICTAVGIAGTDNRLRCCKLRWMVSVVNWWRSRSPVYQNDRRHLCKARWAWNTTSRGPVSFSGDLYIWLFSPKADDTPFTIPRRVEGWVDLGNAVRARKAVYDSIGCCDRHSGIQPWYLTPTQDLMQPSMLPLG